MATANITEILKTLEEASANKELLNALTTSLDKYLATQKSELENLEQILERAKSGDLKVKKRGGYRGRRKKGQEENGNNG
ncbi:hypothetical protein [Adhaeribacter radiodurans]|uniref:Uncharacterized protein n=1 Tax=Adhaeribacter radiodurans TaxID=2745197 RepID=A0A7L7LB48_9BACT|nr:hypothetical protein [Adhaeribacter radiodurans]QMU29957.1 hypothetical protein HUW48_18850 [Adhaeribacter radiodurans]